jgi:hypothetical protein
VSKRLPPIKTQVGRSDPKGLLAADLRNPRKTTEHLSQIVNIWTNILTLDGSFLLVPTFMRRYVTVRAKLRPRSPMTFPTSERLRAARFRNKGFSGLGMHSGVVVSLARGCVQGKASL